MGRINQTGVLRSYILQLGGGEEVFEDFECAL